MTVTFKWTNQHNVNPLNETEYQKCNLESGNHSPQVGPHTFTAPNTTVPKVYYFACGIGGGFHCQYYYMKAKIRVSNKCD